MTGKELKKLLKEACVSQSKLSHLLEINQATVSRWANNTRPISKGIGIAIKIVLQKEKKA